MDISVLEENIGYTFKKKKYLQEALTHSSYANDNQKKFNNERMEFLGDAVLSFVSAEYLYERYPDMAEGELSKLRSSLVCTQSLSNFAREINLGDFLLLGRGEMKTGGSDRDSNLENAFEALIAAIYLDGGIEPAKKHILRFLARDINTHHILFKDYKTLSASMRQQLLELGFEITEEGKHYRLIYYGDGRYKTTIAKTGSDWREGKNIASVILKSMM